MASPVRPTVGTSAVAESVQRLDCLRWAYKKMPTRSGRGLAAWGGRIGFRVFFQDRLAIRVRDVAVHPVSKMLDLSCILLRRFMTCLPLLAKMRDVLTY
jgi:hypothetical protein